MDLLTIKEASDELRVSRAKMFDLLRKKKIKSVKLGARCIRIPRAELEALVSPTSPAIDEEFGMFFAGYVAQCEPRLLSEAVSQLGAAARRAVPTIASGRECWLGLNALPDGRLQVLLGPDRAGLEGAAEAGGVFAPICSLLAVWNEYMAWRAANGQENH